MILETYSSSMQCQYYTIRKRERVGKIRLEYLNTSSKNKIKQNSKRNNLCVTWKTKISNEKVY